MAFYPILHLPIPQQTCANPPFLSFLSFFKKIFNMQLMLLQSNIHKHDKVGYAKFLVIGRFFGPINNNVSGSCFCFLKLNKTQLNSLNPIISLHKSNFIVAKMYYFGFILIREINAYVSTGWRRVTLYSEWL